MNWVCDMGHMHWIKCEEKQLDMVSEFWHAISSKPRKVKKKKKYYSDDEK